MEGALEDTSAQIRRHALDKEHGLDGVELLARELLFAVHGREGLVE